MGDSSSDEDDKDKEVDKLFFFYQNYFTLLSCFQVEELDPYDGWRISKTCDSIASREHGTCDILSVNGDAEENN